MIDEGIEMIGGTSVTAVIGVMKLMSLGKWSSVGIED